MNPALSGAANVMDFYAKRGIVPEPTSAPDAAALFRHGMKSAHTAVPMFVLAANAATSRAELEAQRARVEALIEELRHGLYSVIAVQSDLLFEKFSRFPDQE